MSGINSVVLSGEVRKVFEKRQIGDNDLDVVSFSVTFKQNKREGQVIVSVFGDLANELEVEEGEFVLIQGYLSEQRWQNKETEEWNGRHDVVGQKVTLVSELEGSPLDD